MTLPPSSPESRAFDRAEFEALLKEVVALREWKAEQERILYAPLSPSPSETLLQQATKAAIYLRHTNVMSAFEAEELADMLETFVAQFPPPGGTKK